MTEKSWEQIEAEVNAIDFFGEFRDRFPEEEREEYVNRVTALAGLMTDGDTREAAIIVDTRKNGRSYFWKDIPDEDRDTKGTVRALETFEIVAPHIAKVRKILKEAGFVSMCDHYEGHHLWVGQITEGPTGWVEHTMRTACKRQENVVWLECCIEVKDDGSVVMGWGDGYHRSLDDESILAEDIPSHMGKYLEYDEDEV